MKAEQIQRVIRPQFRPFKKKKEKNYSPWFRTQQRVNYESHALVQSEVELGWHVEGSGCGMWLRTCHTAHNLSSHLSAVILKADSLQ